MTMLVSQPLFVALKELWLAAGLDTLITGGFYNGEPPAGSQVQRPYLIIRTVAEAPLQFSSKGEYDEVSFECAVATDFYDGCVALLDALLAATLVPLPDLSDGIKLRYLRPGPVRYEQTLNFWLITQEFVARTGK